MASERSAGMHVVASMERSLLLRIFSLLLPLFIGFGHCNRHSDKTRTQNGVQQQEDLAILLFGATGDLASRYLWKAIFDLHLYRGCLVDHLTVYAGSRRRVEDIKNYLDLQLSESLRCQSLPAKDCTACASTFKEIVHPQSLRHEDDYKALGKALMERTQKRKLPVTLLAYLAVPPFAYKSVVQQINTFLRSDDVKLKVVLEKPFGHDYVTCEKLLSDIKEHLSETEVYRIDHYLGKQTVDAILQFRRLNQDFLSKSLSERQVGLIEVVMKEHVDCRGRTAFYDSYGAILDVMQNHQTEVLLRTIMDLPENLENSTDFAIKREVAMQSLVMGNNNNFLLGQYADYNLHRDEGGYGEKHDNEEWKLSRTPTFAVVAMTQEEGPWAGIPMVLLSGKQLNEKSTYVRLWLNPRYDSYFRVSDFEEEHEIASDSTLTFYIHSSVHNGPAIVWRGPIVHSSLTIMNGWHQIDHSCRQCKIFVPDTHYDPYSSLLKAVLQGNKSKFIGSEELLGSWKFWSPLLQSLKFKDPILYDRQSSHVLDFDFICTETLQFKLLNKDAARIPPFCKQHNLTIGSYKVYDNYSVSYLMHMVALQIVCLSRGAFEDGKQLHIALPGGTSVSHLIKGLLKKKDLVVWEVLHLWLIDERCVDTNSSLSNYKNLHDQLIKNTPLKSNNLHPILQPGTSCDDASMQYQHEIINLIPGGVFDVIILGLGIDGHIASIFPNDMGIIDNQDLVAKTDRGPASNVPVRITLTPVTLTQAKNVMVLVLGQQKQKVYHEICCDIAKQRHLQVLSREQRKFASTEWYVDNAVGQCKCKKIILRDEL